ncbi:MAG: hypothetical protein NDJ90_04990, partial [Oligoflexia bacterium]|nr:hypothetical protein [Oligoflexia bacterium]
ETTSWARLHESRGSLTAWLLMGVGAAYLLWSLLKLFRQKRHVHFHLHDGDTAHAHVHDHGRLIHMHVHPKARLTPWVLFAIFVFGPCESLIPLMLSGFALGGAPAMFWVALLFSGATVMTIILSVAALLAGIRKVSLRFLERYAGAAAGFSLILCGAAIRFLGL